MVGNFLKALRNRLCDDSNSRKNVTGNDADRQTLLNFVVAMLTVCAGAAITVIVVENNYKNKEKKKYLFPSALLFSAGVIVYAITLCGLLFGCQGESGNTVEKRIKKLKIISVLALVVPGAAIVLGLIAMNK